MSAILALPAPTSLPAISTAGRARALLSSEALPVTAIRPTPDQERRQQLRQAAGFDEVDGESSSADSARAIGGGRSQRGQATEGQNNDAGGGARQGQGAAVSDPLQTQNAGPSAGFVAQSLYQESMGSGLHIEPWDQALGAYRRAEAATALNSRASFTI